MTVVILIGKCYFKPMAKETDSKEKTVLAAAKLLRQQGYYGTAMSEILAAGGSPRGSLYFHFPGGKEEIAEAALALAAESVRQVIAQVAETSQNAEQFLIRIARGMAADLERSDFKEGCPIAPTALEITLQMPLVAAATSNGFRKWEHEIARGLERFAMTPKDAELVATTALSQLEGALLLARTYRDLEPMRRAEKAMALLLGVPR